MKKPHSSDRELEKIRPTIPQPKAEENFMGWGPRFRY